MKKLLSVLLVIAMLLTSVSTGLLGFAADVPNVSEQRIEIKVDPGQTIYQWGDEIIFNVDVENNTGSAMEGIEVRSEAYRKNLFATVDSDVITIDKLEAGESTRIQFKYQAINPNFIQKLVLLPIYAIFDCLAPLKFKPSSFDKVEKLRVGSFNYRFGFDVYDGKVVNQNQSSEDPYLETGNISFNKGVFAYDEKVGAYRLNTEKITGRLNVDINSIMSFDYKVKDDKGIEITGGSIQPDRNWSIEKISFIDGYNVLTVNAIDKNGASYDKTVSVYANYFINPENAIVDTEKDTDDDGLSDYLENYFGTNPYISDTDEDGLTDWEEVNYFNYNPLSKDTGNTGIIDSEKDYDNDGINNITEFQLGIDPTYEDTDFDFLTDYDEVITYNTNPLKPDTDDDGVSDYEEIKLGSDPLEANASFEVKFTGVEPNEDLPVTVDLVATTSGENANDLEVNLVSAGKNPFISSTIPGYLGNAYEFSTKGTLETAVVTFKYDISLGTIGEGFQPRIYYLNEETGELEELPNQTVKDGEVTAVLEHFSTYILLNKVEFDNVWENEIKPVDYQGSNITGLDVVFVIDSSGSMSSNDRTGLRRRAAKEFVAKLGENDRAAVIDFDSSATVYQSFTSDFSLVNSAIDRVNDSGGTSLSAGISLAINQFVNSYSRTDAYKYIIFLTDGDGSYNSSYTTTAANNDIVIYTVGLGSGVKENVLKAIAEGTNGKYYFATEATDLLDIYDTIADETIDYVTDSNTDGISDYYTRLLNDGVLVLPNGSTEMIGVADSCGWDNDDWDGDGLLNGEELVVTTTSAGKTYVKYISNPRIVDTDGDGYNDFEEIKGRNTNPLAPTFAPGASLDTLSTNDYYWYMAYADDYEDGVLGKIVTKGFDWHKTEESRKQLITYFYDYASEESIKKNQKAIDKMTKRDNIINVIDVVSNVLQSINTIMDTATSLGADQKQIDDLKKQNSVFKDCNDDLYKYLNSSDDDALEKAVEKPKAILSEIEDLSSFIEKLAQSEWAKGAEDFIKLTSSTVSLISKFSSKSQLLPVGKGLTKFASKYQYWCNKELPIGSVGTWVGIGFDLADTGVKIAETYSNYAKIEANSDAFIESFEAIEYVAANGRNETFIKNAAGEVMDIVLNDAEGYYKAYAEAASVRTALEFGAKVVVGLLADACPYVAIAKVALSVILSITGITGEAKDEVIFLVDAALTDAFKNVINSKIIRTSQIYFECSADDKTTVIRYLTHLAQIRVVGEKKAYDHFSPSNLGSWISSKVNDYASRREDTLDNINAVKSAASSLNLVMSSKL